MKKNTTCLSEILRFPCRLLFLLVAAIVILGAGSVIAAGPVDGTHRLRALKPVLDQQLRARYLSDSSFRRMVKASSRSSAMVVGESEIGFQVYNFAANVYEYRVGRLVARGNHCNVFMELENAGIFGEQSSQALARIVENFDNKVFPTVVDWFGRPKIPVEYSLPDDRIYIFLVDIRDKFDEGYVAGYFDHRDLEGLFGNQKPVFFMDINPGTPGNQDDKNNSFYRTMAHELQHMVNFSIRHAAGVDDQDRWLDEGMAMFSEYIYSGEVGEDSQKVPPTPHFERFLENPAVNLLSNSKESWFKEDSLYRQYGASFMFMAYMIEKYGGNSKNLQQSFVRELVRTSETGVAGINAMFSSHGTGFNEIFSNFILALHIDQSTAANGMWGWTSKTSSFGKSADMLPLKMPRHYAKSTAGSFIGSNGQSLANSVNIEEIAGLDSVTLDLSGDAGMNLYIAELLPDMTGSIRSLDLKNGSTRFTADLSDGRRLFVLPLALANDLDDQARLNYSFRSGANNLVMYPVPNPAFSEQFIILLKSFSGALEQPPTLRIAFNNILDSPKFEAVDDTDTLFIAHYQLPGNGRGQAFCYYGEDSCSFSFSAVRMRASSVALASTEEATLIVDGANSGIAAISKPDGFLSLPSGAFAGPYDVNLPAQASASLMVAGLKAGQSGACQIDSRGNLTGWSPFLATGSEVVASLKSPGRYFVARDIVPPSLSDLQLVPGPADTSLLRFSATDGLSGIAPDSIKVVVDNKSLTKSFADSWQRGIDLGFLESGPRQIELEVSDCAGNVARAALRAVVAPSSSFRTEVFPNPCQKNVHLKMVFNSMPVYSQATVKFYDVSGALVETLELLPEGTRSLAATWNLTSRNGRAVGNGTYFFRASVSDGSNTSKATGKIAVLR